MNTNAAVTPVSATWQRLRARTRFPWFLCLNVIALLYMVPAVSLFLFYASSAVIIAGRERALTALNEQRKGWVNGIAALLITAILLVLRDADWLASVGVLRGTALGMVQGWQIAAVGMSYCWLRVLYVLFASDRLTSYEFARYYFFAPSFVSGPIMSPEQYLEQSPTARWQNFQVGCARLLLGGGRYILAMSLQQGISVTNADTMRYALMHYSVPGLWGMAFLAGFWLYLNFSAFMDIAIGISRLLGIRVPENFNNPFIATDITDFWRRWHITLGLWLRAHVFSTVARLGGEYLAPGAFVVGATAALLTMVACGLWHKPTLCYVVWGALHGSALIVHMAWGKTVGAKLHGVRDAVLYKATCWLITHAYVALTWVFFFPVGQTNWGLSVSIVAKMFGFES